MLELLQLSGQILLLMLAASALAACIGWWLRGIQAPQPSPASISSTPPEQPVDTAELQTLRKQLADSEQQCSSTLELRDNAEQDARTQRQLVHSLEEQQQRLHTETATLKQQLQEAEKSRTTLQQQLGQTAEAHATEAQELRSRMMAAESASARAQADYQEVASQVAQAKAEAQTQRSLCSAAEKAQKSAEERYKALSTEWEKHKQTSHQTEKKLQTELHALEQQLQASSQKLAELEAAHAQTLAALAAAQSPAEGSKPKRKPPTKRTLAISSGESPVVAMQSADTAARGRLQELESEYEQRLAAVNALDAATPVDKPALAAARSLLRETQKHLATARTEVERTTRQLAALERTFAKLPEGEPDDLTLIKGVKTILAGKLHAMGIYTYQQILDWSAEERVAYGELLGFGNRIDRDDWVGQVQKLQAEKATA